MIAACRSVFIGCRSGRGAGDGKLEGCRAVSGFLDPWSSRISPNDRNSGP